MSCNDLSLGFVIKNRFSNLSCWRELVIATRFGLVGISATSIHIVIVWLVMTLAGLNPILANTIAFTCAFCISFMGNYIWTFRSPGSPRRAMFRFFIISAIAFFLNTSILVVLVQGGWFSHAVSAIISASLVPIISFIAIRFWGFNGHVVITTSPRNLRDVYFDRLKDDN